MTEKFGYKKLTKEDKAKIFGLNAARLYKVDVKAKRSAMSASMIEKFKKREWAEDGTGKISMDYRSEDLRPQRREALQSGREGQTQRDVGEYDREVQEERMGRRRNRQDLDGLQIGRSSASTPRGSTKWT